jgi:hypothetical protein
MRSGVPCVRPVARWSGDGAWLTYLHHIDLDAPKPGLLKGAADVVVMEIAEGHPLDEFRRIVGKGRACRIRNDLAHRIGVQPVPHIEQIEPAMFENTQRLAIGSLLIRKEHDAELVDHHVEAVVAEGQRLRIGLPPCHVGRIEVLGGKIEHCLIKIDRDGFGLNLRQLPRDDKPVPAATSSALPVETFLSLAAISAA